MFINCEGFYRLMPLYSVSLDGNRYYTTPEGILVGIVALKEIEMCHKRFIFDTISTSKIGFIFSLEINSTLYEND